MLSHTSVNFDKFDSQHTQNWQSCQTSSTFCHHLDAIRPTCGQILGRGPLFEFVCTLFDILFWVFSIFSWFPVCALKFDELWQLLLHFGRHLVETVFTCCKCFSTSLEWCSRAQFLWISKHFLCGSRNMPQKMQQKMSQHVSLQNFLALEKIGFDTAKREPSTVCWKGTPPYNYNIWITYSEPKL